MADIAKALDLLKDKGPRKIAFVHGIPAMRETYVDFVAHACTHTERMEVSTDADLADILGYTPLHTGTTAVIVRGAQHLTDASAPMLLRYASTRSKAHSNAVHFVLVADFEAWPTLNKRVQHPALRDVFAAQRTSTLLVDATLANTQIGHTKAADVVRHLSGCTRTQASTLAATCCYDMAAVKEVTAKATALGTFEERHLKALAGREAPLEYADALLRCDKPLAALVARHVPATAYASTIARLDFALDVLSRIHRTMKENDSTYTLSTRMGVHRTTIDRYRPLAQHYGSATVARRSTALLWASQQVALGRREGVLEMLAVQW